jgi:hypothetical protein
MFEFLNSMFLWAAGAAVIPLVLHLMQRRRTVRVMFGTIRFLKQAHRRSVNRLRLENFLLWLVRTLLLLAIALAFAAPVMRAQGWGGALGRARRDVAIVWDASYSMAYNTAQRNVWDTSRDAILAIVSELQPGDRVSLFLAAEQPVPLVEQPSGDINTVLALVKGQVPRPVTSQLAETVRAACQSIENSDGREREVYIVTDGQSLPWQSFQPDRDAGPQWDADGVDASTAFFVFVAGATAPENVYPKSIRIEPALVTRDATARISVNVGHSGTGSETSVALFVNDSERARRRVAINADEGAEVSFLLPPMAPGIHAARVETAVDGLSIDNTFHFLLRVRDRPRALVVGTESDAFYLGRALHPRGATALADIGGIAFQRVDPDNTASMSLHDVACVFLCNALPLSGQEIVRLESYVRQGGLLCLYPGDRAKVEDYASWSIWPALPERVVETDANTAHRPLRLMASPEALFRSLKLPPGTVPSVTARRMLQWKTDNLDPDAVVMMAGADQPFLLSRQVDKGRALMFAVTADRRWSDWPLSPLFLPVSHEIALFGAGLVREPPFVWTAASIDLADITRHPEELKRLVSPSGRILPARMIQSESIRSWLVDGVAEQGVYGDGREEGGGGAPVMAVNMPRTESDLATVSDREMIRLLAMPVTRVTHDVSVLVKQIGEHRSGKPLTEPLLWVVLVLAVSEVCLANWMGHRRGRVETGQVLSPR